MIEAGDSSEYSIRALVPSGDGNEQWTLTAKIRAQLPHRLQAAADAQAPRGWLHARLTVRQAHERGFGLLGSSMFVINPPWTLHDTLQQTLPYLVDVLGQYDGANFLLEQRAA